MAAVLVLPALAAAALAVAWRCRGRGALRLPRPAGLDALGVMAVLGALLFYHRNYDNIMLVPALLALFRRSLQRPAPATIALTTSLALSLWLPTRVLVALPWLMPAQSLVWLAAGLVLAFRPAPEAPRPGPAAAAAQSVSAAA